MLLSDSEDTSSKVIEFYADKVIFHVESADTCKHNLFIKLNIYIKTVMDKRPQYMLGVSSNDSSINEFALQSLFHMILGIRGPLKSGTELQ